MRTIARGLLSWWLSESLCWKLAARPGDALLMLQGSKGYKSKILIIFLATISCGSKRYEADKTRALAS